jgi:hypothetical protein
MTKPLHVTRAQAKRLERNLAGERKAKKAKRESPWRITLHAAPDVQPETLAALAALARRVMEMPEDELREFLKKVRKA